MNRSQDIPGYAELVCTSNFTFLQGASHPQELVTRAAELGYEAIALTDECSLAGIVRAYEATQRCAAEQLPVKLICGSRFTLEDGSGLVLLAADKTGYAQLCGLVTRGRRDAPKGGYELPDKAFEAGLGHCLALWLPGTHNPSPENDMLLAHWVASHFPGRSWLAVSLELGFNDESRLARLAGIGNTVGLPLTACGDVQ
ncbi:MAG: PHP domain-containing protein, partial [Lysobacterales bacterium]